MTLSEVHDKRLSNRRAVVMINDKTVHEFPKKATKNNLAEFRPRVSLVIIVRVIGARLRVNVAPQRHMNILLPTSPRQSL